MRANHNNPLVKRTFALGICNGALWQFANAFLNPSTVVPAFIVTMPDVTAGQKMLWVGIITACMNSGWSWPQVFLGRYYSTKQRLLPFYWISAIGRALIIVLLTVVVAVAYDAKPVVVLASIAGLFLLYGSCGAIGIIPFMTIVSDSMPASHRGRFFGFRSMAGGVLGMVAGFIVSRILNEDTGLGYPDNYVPLFGVAAVVFIASVICFSCVKEPAHEPQTRRLTMAQELARGPRLFRRDRDWRTLVIAQVVGAIGFGVSVPFMTPFALEELHAPTALVGIFLACQTGAAALSNLIWSYVGDKRGNRKLLIWSGVAGVLPALIALLSSLVPATEIGTLFGVKFTYQLAVFTLAFIPLGFSMTGQMIGQLNFLLDIAPNRRRATYLAFSHLFRFPLAWWPVAGALLIGRTSFVFGFAIAIICSAVTLYLVTRLGEPRAQELGLEPPGPDNHDRPMAAGG